jgi:predicted O-linked N-acetylglucosamine transferase (SPINDLY family)
VITPAPEGLPLAAALQQAVAHHHAGRMQEAEQLYRAILLAQPGQPTASHNLGVLAIQAGQPAIALPFLKAALEADRSREQYWLSYAGALLASSQAGEARSVLQSALQHGVDGPTFKSLRQQAEAAIATMQAPGDTPTAEEMSRLASLLGAKRHDELEKLARLLAGQYPNCGLVWKILGAFLHVQGKDALPAFLKASELLPGDAEAHANLGVVLKKAERFDAALVSYRRALEIKPDYAKAHNELGNLLSELGRLDDAVLSYRRALEIKPDHAETLNDLGVVLKKLGRLDEAEACYRNALKVSPNQDNARNNLGNLLKDIGRLDEAVASFRRALEIRPDQADTHNNLSIALRNLGRLDDAAASCQRAIELKPDHAEAHNNLGNAMRDLGQLDGAIASYRRALEIKPGFMVAHSNLLFCLNYHPDLPAESIFAEYRRWQELQARVLLDTRPSSNDRDAERRLRIGYVSPDLRRHPVRHFVEPLLAQHDKTQFEVFAYAEVAREDDDSARLKTYVDHWRNTVGISDHDLAETMRNDRIDVLIDLAGHTANNRLAALARKPAPILVSWLGYGYTTGLDAFDYFLADPEFAPPGCESLFAEKLVRLPVMTAYRPAEGMGEPGPLPAARGAGVSFGTLSRSVRINHHVVRTWAQILKRLPDSRLIINSKDFSSSEMQTSMLERFAEHGIAAEQLEIGFESPAWNVLGKIDIGLDCFPHNSGTTLIESLYMGVPYVTLRERPSVGRLGAAMLRGAGHPEWIAGSEQDYVSHALALAGDLKSLSNLRTGLRQQIEASPLMNEARFARSVETAYRNMWRRWCSGQAATHIEIE